MEVSTKADMVLINRYLSAKKSTSLSKSLLLLVSYLAAYFLAEALLCLLPCSNEFNHESHIFCCYLTCLQYDAPDDVDTC